MSGEGLGAALARGALRRRVNLAGFLLCAGLIAYAIYAQFDLHLDPCPLCIFQRIGIASIGAVTHLHDAQSSTTLLAALGLGMWSLALIARRPLQGALVLIVALAISGLGTGLWLTAVLLLTAAAMPLLPV